MVNGGMLEGDFCYIDLNVGSKRMDRGTGKLLTVHALFLVLIFILLSKAISSVFSNFISFFIFEYLISRQYFASLLAAKGS